MTFELFCMTLIALLIGTAVAFNGYRWFLVLLPIFSFVFGFGLGAQTMQAIFGQALFASVTSWVIGLFVGVIFAVLSYFFYFVGVAIFAGSIGYSVGVGLMQAFGLDFGFIVWLVGLLTGVATAVVVLRFDIQKYLIIFGTALAGTTAIVTGLFFPLGLIAFPQLARLSMAAILFKSPFWLVVFIALLAGAVYTQIVTTRSFELKVNDVKY